MTTILIVDDNLTNRLVLTDLLESDGYRVLQAVGGVEGLALARAERPDVVITDVIMPAMDGYELARQLRTDSVTAESVIIFCTAGYDEQEALPLAHACGVRHIIAKPCEPEELLRVVSAAIAEKARPAVAEVAAKKFEDIHRRVLTDKLSEKFIELEASDLAYRNIFDNAVEGIFQSTPAGTLVSINPALARMYGYDSPAEAKACLTDLAHQVYVDAEQRTEFVRLLQENGEIFNFEYEIYRRDGSRLWVSENVREVRNAAGELVFYEGFVADITQRRNTESCLQNAKAELEQRVAERTAELATVNRGLEGEIAERKRVEAEVQRGQQELQHFVDAMSTMAVKLTLDGTSLIANKIALVASGLTREEYMKTNFLAGPWWSFDAQVQARVRVAFATAVSGTPVNYDEKVFAFGRVIAIDFSLTPVRGDHGAVEYLIAEARDITALKETERALQDAKAEAERANLAKSESVSRISHELRTPLNAILGFAQLLELEELNSEQREGVAHILRGGRHLLDLINQVLDISQIETGDLSISLEPVEILEAIQESFATLRPLASERRVRLYSTCEGPEYVRADRQRLNQVLSNLMSNAIKYNRLDGSVTVSCQRTGERLRISISDTGIGIPADRLEQLFVPFERVGAEQTTTEGTGLGLALVKRLVEAMNGVVVAESTAGRGSTFSIELPLCDSNPELMAVVGGDDSATAACASARTILCIEDNASNFRLVERLLQRRSGITLLGATDGLAGLTRAREQRPHLILLDLNLPDMDGHELLVRLRADSACSSIPVVVISADATETQINRLIQAGAADYLTKPLDVKQFFTVVDQTLASATGPRG